MALRNRVDPFGNLVATDARGTLMGNRGCLHDDSKTVQKAFARKAWVTCRLDWKGIQREVFSLGKYSELFFLDEATALAAGHRPCNDCRSEDYKAFKSAWQATQTGNQFAKAETMDNQIHGERMDAGKGKRTFSAHVRDLPDGVIFTSQERPHEPWLLWCGKSWRWSFQGYSSPLEANRDKAVNVLTPVSICAVLASGYRPNVHITALQK